MIEWLYYHSEYRYLFDYSIDTLKKTQVLKNKIEVEKSNKNSTKFFNFKKFKELLFSKERLAMCLKDKDINLLLGQPGSSGKLITVNYLCGSKIILRGN